MPRKKIQKGISLGADPEGVLLQMLGPKKAQIVPASSFIRDCTYGWGLDGHASTPELRFKPAANAFEVIKIIMPHMAKLNKILPADVKMCAGSGTHSTYNGRYVASGGHIHIGGLVEPTDATVEHYADVLDYLLMIPLMMFEDPTRAKRRRAEGDYAYGMLYNTVKNRVDSSNRAFDNNIGLYSGFEYRPPSSWLVSPAFTRDIFALVHAAIYDLEKGKELPTFSKAFGTKTKLIEACKAHQACEREPFKEHIAKIKKAMAGTTLYTNGYYKKELAGFFGLASAFTKHNKSWNEDDCILTKWGFPRDYSFLSGKIKYPIFGQSGDVKMDEIIRIFEGRRFKRKIYVYGMSDKHGVSFSLHGPFDNPDIPREFFQGNKETRVEANEYQCWIGISKDVRLRGDWAEMKKFLNEVVKKVEVKDGEE